MGAMVSDIKQGKGPKKGRIVWCGCCETKPDLDLTSPSQSDRPEEQKKKVREPPHVPPLNLERLHKPSRPPNILQ